MKLAAEQMVGLGLWVRLGLARASGTRRGMRTTKLDPKGIFEHKKTGVREAVADRAYTVMEGGLKDEHPRE